MDNKIFTENSNNSDNSLLGFSEADKGRLIEKIKITRGRVESKKQELDMAVQSRQPVGVIEVLTLELQQRSLVLQNLEENLASFGE